MTDVPTPNFSDSNGPTLRRIAALFGRGIIYALAFWAVYRGMLWIYPTGAAPAHDQAAYQRQVDTYDAQAARANQMFVESEKQQARMRALMTKQEEQAQRFDAILDRWEKQAGVRK